MWVEISGSWRREKEGFEEEEREGGIEGRMVESDWMAFRTLEKESDCKGLAAVASDTVGSAVVWSDMVLVGFFFFFVGLFFFFGRRLVEKGIKQITD